MKILKDYFEAAARVEREYNEHILKVTEGVIPNELEGTLYHNGNGRFEHFGVKYNHLFDGDGMIAAFRFKNGNVHYNNRYIKTEEWMKEQAKGKFLFRGFGTNKPGGFIRNFLDMRFKNVANTSVVYHAGKLLALWEGGLPHRIDPDTLETLERYDYEGVLQNAFSFVDRQVAPELPFSAHPKISQEGVLYNFGTAAGMKNRLLHYEVSPSGKASIAHITPLKRLNFTHDFILTAEGYKIYFLTPVQFDLFRSFVGLATPAGSMRANKEDQIRILVLDSEYDTIEFQTEFAFIFHFINGFLAGDELIVDGLMLNEWPSAQSMKSFLTGEVDELVPFVPSRFRLNLKTKEVTKEIIAPYGVEFPSHHPDLQGKNYTYAWGIAAPLQNQYASPLLDGLIKLNLKDYGQHQYQSLDGSLPGEPYFVPLSEKEDDGILVLPVFNHKSTKTEIRGYRADTLTHVFTAELPHNIPLGFHGTWVS